MTTDQFRLFVALLLVCALALGGYVTYHATHQPTCQRNAFGVCLK